MRWTEGFRSGAFRFALLLALAFAASATLLLVVVERSISRYAVAATQGELSSEAAILQGEDREVGRADLLKAIDRHRRAGGEEAFRYQLVNRAGRMLVDDLGSGPAKIGWGSSVVREHAQEQGHARLETFISLGVALADGSVLVVATDTYDIQDLRRRLDGFTIIAGIGITLFALVGGYLTGGLFMRRLTSVNAAIDRIMAGNISERLPTIGISREFDQLTANLNAMLGRMEGLMEGLRQVSTDIAHDLRTPLTRLRQQLETMREAGSSDAYEAGVDDAIGQVDEILSIFRALLRIGTLEAGTGRQRFGAVDLSEMAGRVAAAHQPVAEDDGKLLIAAHMPNVLVEGDAELLAQMLTNLIDNAIRHTPVGSRIVSALDYVDGAVVLSVSDDGPGIPADERVHVVKRFYRLDRSRTLPGAGLGMALAAAIAALHEVRFELLDNAPGLLVRLTFPPR